jgi:hypothetical protein
VPANASLVNAVMVSCAQRESARALTIPQLEKAGVAVTVLLDDCTPPVQTPPGNGPIGLKAIRHAIAMGWEHVLIVEDDIDLAPDFPMFVEAALKTNAAVYLYLNDFESRMRDILGRDLTKSILAKEPQPRRLVRARRYAGLFGAQAVLLPAAILPTVEQWQAAKGDSFDGNILRALMHKQFPTLVAIPHPVQHRHDRTARTPDERLKKSRSYALPRVGEEVSTPW